MSRDDRRRGPDDGTEDRLVPYVAAGLAEIEAGRTLDLDALCADAPELAPAVADALGLDALDLGGLASTELAAAFARTREGAAGAPAGGMLGDRYRLDERIGAGAMGIVFRGFDLELDRPVAIKLLARAGGRPLDEAARQRFLREARAVAAVHSRHVVAVHDRGAATAERAGDEVLFLVMELLDGASLADVVQSATEAVARGARLGSQTDPKQPPEWLPAALVAALDDHPARDDHPALDDHPPRDDHPGRDDEAADAPAARAAAGGTSDREHRGSGPGTPSAASPTRRTADGERPSPALDRVGRDGYLRSVVRWIAETAEGLAAAHDRAILHRDVKPSNVFVAAGAGRDELPRAVLLDFGIAAIADGSELTASDGMLGTPWYMAPESVRASRSGRTRIDERTDVYGLAASLYHALALRPPYDDRPMQVLARIPREDPMPVRRAQRPDVARAIPIPRDLAAIVERGIAREARLRYPDARSLAADLRAFLDHRPVGARPIGALTRGWRRLRRRPAPALAVVATVAAAGFAAFGVPARLEARERVAERAYLEAWSGLPPLLAIEGRPTDRRRIPAAEHEDALAGLARALDARPSDPGAHALRAAVLLDSGRPDLAGDTIDDLAEAHGDPFLAALAERYRAAGARPCVDASGLVAPTTRAGRYVQAFVALRGRTPDGVARCHEILAAIDGWWPARDLDLLALLGLAEFESALESARALEATLGRPTARTRHVIAASLTALRRYGEAAVAARAALELCPGRHGPLQNLAIALWRGGERERARAVLLQAHELRPWQANTLMQLTRLDAEAGRLDDARGHAERIPAVTTAGARWPRLQALAEVAWWRMVRSHTGAGGREVAPRDAGAVEGAPGTDRVASIDTARSAFAALLDANPPARVAHDARIALACLDGLRTHDRRFFGQYVEAALADPLRPDLLHNLALTMPPGPLPEALAERLRALLLALAADSAPENSIYVEAAARARARIERREH